jgi:hypothetical protein
MGWIQVRIGQEMPFKDYNKAAFYSEKLTFENSIEKSLEYIGKRKGLSDITMQLPNGEFEIKKIPWQHLSEVVFSIYPDESQMKTFYARLPEKMHSSFFRSGTTTSMEMIREISGENDDALGYSLKVSGKHESWLSSAKPLELSVQMPERILQRNVEVDGFVFDNPKRWSTYEKIKTGYETAKRIMDDAVLNLGFESAGALEPHEGQKVVQVCLMPRKIKSDDLLELMESLDKKSGITKVVFKVNYVNHGDYNLYSTFIVRYAEEENIKVDGSIEGHKEYISEFAGPLLKIFDAMPREDSLVDVGFLKVRPGWEKTSKYGGIFLGALASIFPQSLIDSTWGAYRKNRRKKKSSSEQLKMLRESVTEAVTTDYLLGLGLTPNKDFSDSCMTVLTSEGREELDKLIEEEFERAKDRSQKK